jgi:hypothetical protein
MLSLGIYGSDRRDPPTDPSRIVWELYPSGTLARTIRLRNLLEPEHAKASAQGSGAGPSLTLPVSREPEPDPWLLPGLRQQSRPRHKKTRPKLSRLGGSSTQHFGHGLAGHSPDKVAHGV